MRCKRKKGGMGVLLSAKGDHKLWFSSCLFFLEQSLNWKSQKEHQNRQPKSKVSSATAGTPWVPSELEASDLEGITHSTRDWETAKLMTPSGISARLRRKTVVPKVRTWVRMIGICQREGKTHYPWEIPERKGGTDHQAPTERSHVRRILFPCEILE